MEKKNYSFVITLEQIIKQFQLSSHPEGGYSSILYEDPDTILKESLPDEYKNSRPFWNSIYYLLPGDKRCILHRLRMPELWNFYLGGTLELYDISPEGVLKKILLGRDILNGEQFAYVFPKNHWIGAKPKNDMSFSFVSCVTCPGFTFDDWEKGKRDQLLRLYPKLENVILDLT